MVSTLVVERCVADHTFSLILRVSVGLGNFVVELLTLAAMRHHNQRRLVVVLSESVVDLLALTIYELLQSGDDGGVRDLDPVAGVVLEFERSVACS